MPLHSAGILLYRYQDGHLEIFLGHPGGPFWSKKDEGAWSIPKGLYEAGEEPLAAARREFREETGTELSGEFLALGESKQPGGKTVHAWAMQGDLDPGSIVSNTYALEWPKGTWRRYPEIDRAAWFAIDVARRKVVKGQVMFLDRLEQALHSAT